MNNLKTAWWAIASISIVAALLIAPPTRQSTWSLMRATVLSLHDRTPERCAACARSHPNDYPIQLANALSPNGLSQDGSLTSPDLNRLYALEARFRQDPSPVASTIGALLPMHLLDARRERQLETGVSRFAPPSAPLLASLSAQCAVGEHLDPGNAFFPAIQMSVLLAANKDDQAQLELERAAECNRWRDYSADETRGQWRITELLLGFDPPIRRLVEGLQAHLFEMRSLTDAARVETVMAWEQDEAGHPERALAIRFALMRIGSLARVGAPSLLEAFHGAGMEQLSPTHLRGPISRTLSPQMTEKQWRARYFGYLSQHGHAADISAVDAQFNAGQRVIKLCNSSDQTGQKTSGVGAPIGFLIVATFFWRLGLLFFVAELLTCASARSGEFWRLETMTTPKRLGILCGIATGTIAEIGLVAPTTSVGKLCLIVGGSQMVAGYFCAAIGWKRRDISDKLWHGAAAVSIISTVVVACLSMMLIAGAGVDQYRGTYIGITRPGNSSADWREGTAALGAVLLGGVALILAPNPRQWKTQPSKRMRAMGGWMVVGAFGLFAIAQIGLASERASTQASSAKAPIWRDRRTRRGRPRYSIRHRRPGSGRSATDSLDRARAGAAEQLNHLGLDHFTHRVARQIGDAHEPRGNLIDGETFPCPGTQIWKIQRSSFEEHDRNCHSLAPFIVRKPDHRALVDRWMEAKLLFDLQGRDFVASGLDDVDRVAAKDSVDRVLPDRNVPGPEPTVDECCRSCVGFAPILLKDGCAANLDLARNTVGDGLVEIVRKSDLDARQRRADMAGYAVAMKRI